MVLQFKCSWIQKYYDIWVKEKGHSIISFNVQEKEFQDENLTIVDIDDFNHIVLNQFHCDSVEGHEKYGPDEKDIDENVHLTEEINLEYQDTLVLLKLFSEKTFDNWQRLRKEVK